MAEGEELIEVKFRTNDGTDVAHGTYALSTNVATLKQKMVAEWPQKTVTPKSINDLKIIHAGKVLENNKTLAGSRITFGDLPAGVITMHVIVQPAIAKNKSGLSSCPYIFIDKHVWKMNLLGILSFLELACLHALHHIQDFHIDPC
ncbi:hypothetical protein GOBAR_AA13968 [Gossypium barbadense]|uniref:Ubiquitin-like domain-containing protein n=1 Tax=Gossypium barbadense TaxID=3634 RepID=A0A2P5XTM4_GOSBA|nr:hypothetical protein GOBAR_AA13968 [Gossypium barbadense]